MRLLWAFVPDLLHHVMLLRMTGAINHLLIRSYNSHVSQHSPKPLLGGLLTESCKGSGFRQYDCAFIQNLIIVTSCCCISVPFFRCKLREQYGIKVPGLLFPHHSVLFRGEALKRRSLSRAISHSTACSAPCAASSAHSKSSARLV